ncbi:YihY family inner membrane protein [Marinomonas sp. 15G1-11]|uniref:YihY family inner membrane protein n=1 Tax=Marinomonas phaeophyticola TaxID=3004091 RepID=A0ABT4JZ69_9GAMM|nr:YihY family inner membrane protein [Marinomonas sp. 15G1-11]MCZ2722804.1 YihY family inner membrane protein [Marinomonas sp. 15G1-11]
MTFKSALHFTKNYIFIVYKCYRESNSGLRAAQLTLASLLAAVPIITIILGILGFTPALQEMQSTLLQLLETHLAPGTSDVILPYLITFSDQARSLPLAGLVMLILTALLLLNSFEVAVQEIWKISSLRNIRERLLTYWAILTLGPILLAASLSVYGTLLSFKWQGVAIGEFTTYLVEFSSVILYFIMIFALNYLSPNATVKAKKAAIAAIFATVALSLLNTLFTSFAQLFANYQVVYGAFAALPTLIVWLQLSWHIILISTCLCASLHQHDFNSNKETTC